MPEVLQDHIPDAALMESLHTHRGLVIGIDEAGRGPWAGLVTAAAVLFDAKQAQTLAPYVKDSKAMTRRQREKAYALLTENLRYGIGEASPQEITDLNILQATFLAMARAVQALGVTADYALVDGNIYPAHTLPCPGEAVIKGDAHVFSISAASIIAKVTRDRTMAGLALLHPQYGWEKNSGYGTAAHREAMLRHGITPHHRTGFKPVRDIYQNVSNHRTGDQG